MSAVATWMKEMYEDALLAMGQQVSKVKEVERIKIAEHLHDEFGQDLLVAKMRLRMLSEELPEQYIGSINGITEIISGLIRRTRATIEELYSQPRGYVDIKSSLKSLAEDVQIKHGIACSANLDSLPGKLTDEAKQVLYRAVREFLCNVTKHARASRIKINVSRKHSSVKIEVKDNGRGFERQKAHVSEDSNGFGLLSVRADLARIGAELQIFSRIGKGTRAIITVPLDAA
jgi:signal transduction histidine kinase